MNIDWSWWGYWQNDEWAERWVLFLLLPLTVGSVVGCMVAFWNKSASRNRAPASDPQGDWVKNLTFLGTAVTAGAAFIGSRSDDRQEDLGILVASNVVYAALASAHPLLLALSNDRPKFGPLREGWTNSLAGAAVLCSAVASLTSIAVLVWRSEIVPDMMRWFFTVLFLAAAVLVSCYVRERAKGVDTAPTRGDDAIKSSDSS